MNRSLLSYLTAGFLLACLGFAATYAYDLVRPRADAVTDLRVGGRYRIGRRRVRCLALGDDRPPFRAVLWRDEDTGNEGWATYTHSATFTRRRGR